MSTLPLFGDEGSGRGRSRDEPVYRVAAINRMVRMLLEDRYRNVWIGGELSDVTRAGSGHVYFTLNDEQEVAQLRGVMFRSDARRARAKLVDGARVKLRGQLSLFEPRGGFQLIARIALPQGLGDLHAQFEAIRQQLQAEGLLDPQRKRALPRRPSVIGVVTSPSGAAVHDIVRVATGRCPVRLVLAPCVVQGPEAPRSIVAALHAVQSLPDLDLVIVGRGGGSAEDLWAFNDERVARAIAACRVPTVSAVGHEVDVSIADLVADVRAATPSNAAELAVPDRSALGQELHGLLRDLQRAMEGRLVTERMRLARAESRLNDPRALLHGLRQRLGQGRQRMIDALRARLRPPRQRLAVQAERLGRLDPRILTARRRARLLGLQTRLQGLGRQLTRERRAQLATFAGQLSALSPLAVLSRGYAIALHADRALLKAGDARPGDALRVRLHEGVLHTRVERVEEDSS